MPKLEPIRGKAPSSGLKVRIRSVVGYQWIWELLSRDRHIVATSPRFATREDCEADALRQGEPVEGLRRQSKALGANTRVRPQSAQYLQDDAQLWRWELHAPSGALLAQSKWAFLTREECEADFREHAHATLQQDEPPSV